MLISAGILLSRIAGFARQRAIAHFLGAGSVVDAFSAALRIPNLLQNLLGEGVLSASFIPVYSRLLAEGREDEAGRVAGAVAGLLTLVAGLLVVVGVVFAAPLATVLAPGFVGPKRALTITLMRVLFPGVGFLVLSAWCLGVLNSHRRFFLSYVAPVLWNAAQITALLTVGLVGWSDAGLAIALAWGALVGGGLQFAVQLPKVLTLARSLRPSLDTGNPGVRAAVRAFGPVVAGRGVVQLASYVELSLASLLAAGAVAALTYAQQLFILPISLFGMSVAAAELPELSSADPRDRAHIGGRLEEGLARIAFYVVPSTVAFFVIGDLIVGAIYRTGAFGALEVRQVWLVLAAFSVGLLANTSSRLLQSSFYAAGNAATPARIAALRVVIAAAVGAFLMLQLDRIALTAQGGLVQVGELPALQAVPAQLRVGSNQLRLGACGLAIAAGVSAWVEFALLRRQMRRAIGRPVRAGGGQLATILTAAVVAAGVALGLRILVSGWHPLASGSCTALLMGITYLGVAHRLGVGESVTLVRSLRRAKPRS